MVMVRVVGVVPGSMVSVVPRGRWTATSLSVERRMRPPFGRRRTSTSLPLSSTPTLPRLPLLLLSLPLLLLSTFLLLPPFLAELLLLERLEPERVVHQRLVGGLFLLLDRKQRILTDLGGRVSGGVGVLLSLEGLLLSFHLAERQRDRQGASVSNTPSERQIEQR